MPLQNNTVSCCHPAEIILEVQLSEYSKMLSVFSYHWKHKRSCLRNNQTLKCHVILTASIFSFVMALFKQPWNPNKASDIVESTPVVSSNYHITYLSSLRRTFKQLSGADGQTWISTAVKSNTRTCECLYFTCPVQWILGWTMITWLLWFFP